MMNHLLLMVLLLTETVAGRPKKLIPLNKEQHIIGGGNTNIESHQHIGSLRNIGQHACGCFIIQDSGGSTNYVLTSALCVQSFTANNVQILFGTASRSNIDNQGQLSSVTLIKLHENFNNGI